jgi:hypothetical protein
MALLSPRRSPLAPLKKATVYTQVGWTSFLDLNPPNPLKKGAKIRILVPLFKGDLAAPVRRVPRRFRETRQGDLQTTIVTNKTFQTPSKILILDLYPRKPFIAQILPITPFGQ